MAIQFDPDCYALRHQQLHLYAMKSKLIPFESITATKPRLSRLPGDDFHIDKQRGVPRITTHPTTCSGTLSFCYSVTMKTALPELQGNERTRSSAAQQPSREWGLWNCSSILSQLVSDAGQVCVCALSGVVYALLLWSFMVIREDMHQT